MLKTDIRIIIRRVIIAIIVAMILCWLRDIKVLAATCPTTTNTYDARYTSGVSYSNSGNAWVTSWGNFVGTTNMGTAITRPSGTNSFGLPKVLTMLSLKHSLSSGTFTAGNTYNFVVRVNTSSNSVANYYKQYAQISYVRGGTSTSNLTDSNIQSFTLDRIKVDDDDSKIFYIYYSITPNSNVSIIWTYITLVDLDVVYSSFDYIDNGNVVVRQSACSYSEGSNSYIQQTTNAIISQTKEIIKLFNIDKEELDYLQDDTDAAVDVSGMTGITGLLPPGPLDSLLSIPITILNIFIDSSSGTCTPFTFTFVFNEEFTLPCFDVFWNQVPSSLLLFMSDLPAVILFIMWAKSIYKRVERATSFESSVDDEWGGV